MDADPALRIAPAAEDDLPDLLESMVAYGTFYGTQAREDDLVSMGRAFLAADGPGTQLVARDGQGRLVAHATILWSWDTTAGLPVATMEDLYVAAGARGAGVGRALIEACCAHAAERGIGWLQWETAPDNHAAQHLYDTLGATRDSWYSYRLPTAPPAT